MQLLWDMYKWLVFVALIHFGKTCTYAVPKYTFCPITTYLNLRHMNISFSDYLKLVPPLLRFPPLREPRFLPFTADPLGLLRDSGGATKGRDQGALAEASIRF